MPYFSVSDERFVNGFEVAAGARDAPSNLNEDYALAEGQFAYGTLVDDFVTGDRDIFSFGYLSAGTYIVDVDDFTWDFTNFDLSFVSNFSVVNSFGGTVVREFSTTFDLTFDVVSGGNYYLEIEGPAVGEAQYRAIYYQIASNSPTVWGDAVFFGEPEVGNSISASVQYFDADGNSDGVVLTGWHLDDDFFGYSESFTIVPEDVGRSLGVSFGLIDDLGNSELSPIYPIGTVTPSISEGTADNDLLIGNQEDNSLLGFGGDDSLSGLQGDDQLDGGLGLDTASYSGNQTSFTLTLSPQSATISDRRFDGLGTDTLIDIEFLDFSTDLLGGPFDLRQFGGPAGLAEDEFESFIELYIAYFNRAPDAIGLNFWGTAFAKGTTLEQMASLFIDQDETRETYPDGTTNTEFATTVYNNVLGRTPDQSGIDFWVGALDSGDVSRDQFILEVLRGAKSELKPEEGQAFVDQQLADRVYLENKVDIGAYFAVHRGMSDLDNASAAMATFDGSQGSIILAVAEIDKYYQGALDANDGEFLMQVVGVLDNPFAV